MLAVPVSRLMLATMIESVRVTPPPISAESSPNNKMLVVLAGTAIVGMTVGTGTAGVGAFSRMLISVEPSAGTRCRSAVGDGVGDGVRVGYGVFVGVGVRVGVLDAVGEGPGVGVASSVGVAVGVAVSVGVGVSVAVGDGVFVAPTERPNPATTVGVGSTVAHPTNNSTHNTKSRIRDEAVLAI